MPAENPFDIPEAKFRELEHFILQSIRRNVDVQEGIIPAISQMTDWDWDQSKQLVDHVCQVHNKEIALFSRSIFLLVISTGFLIFIILNVAFISLIGFENLFSCKAIDLPHIWEVILGFGSVQLCLFMNADYISRFIVFLLVSLLVMLGTILGLFYLVRYLREREIES
jgi:hypothetical protein